MVMNKNFVQKQHKTCKTAASFARFALLSYFFLMKGSDKLFKPEMFEMILHI